MSYADATYYTSEFKGTVIPAEVLEKYLMLASHSVDTVTYRRIPLFTLTSYQESQVKMATCFQAEYLYTYGESIEANIQNYSIGDVSLSYSDKIDKRYSRQMLDYLKPTGFLSRLL